METVIVKIIPLIFLISLGVLIRKGKLVSAEVMEGIKTLIVNLALPAVLFFAFVKSTLTSQYVALFALVFTVCILFYSIGLILRKVGIFKAKYSPGFMTGFEFGMVGVAFFGGIFGFDKLPVITLIALGHELFIWFVYVPLLTNMQGGEFKLGKTLKTFLSSPLIIAIISALIINLAGWLSALESFFFTRGVLDGLQALSGMTMPLILLVVGYSLDLSKISWRESSRLVAARTIVVALGGWLLYFIINLLQLNTTPLFGWAFLTFFMLPPPYILPLYIPADMKEEGDLFTGSIVFYTVFCLAVYLVTVFIFNPAI